MRRADPAGDRLQATPVPAEDSPYWSFYARVASAQLSEWLPETPARVLDLSGCSAFSGQLLAAGHEVVHAAAGLRSQPDPPAHADRLLTVVADSRSLGWLADASVDVVLAESRMLSTCLATEVTVEHLVRVLRPGGRLLLVVDSLALGLARLADQGRWAELADVPSADVVLVPGEDGTITRCFWPEELHDLLVGAGLTVDWVRARSVLAVTTVERALQQGGEAALATLVKTELALTADRQGESTGLHLVASARLPH
ncbi:MAG: methyltransferase domain-containing protein [Frankiales bacterium]|nr:methyltransferase domain-containing protein [Frankiales bacterium]